MRVVPTILLIVSGLVFVGCGWYALGRRVVRGEKHCAYSSYRSDRVGTRRLFLFYEDAGLAPVRLKRELLMLEEKGMLFVIEPRRVALRTMMGGTLPDYDIFLSQELDAIETWVREGNSLVLAASENTELHERLGVELQSGSPGRTRDALRTQVSPLTRSLGRLKTRRDSALVFDGPAWVELFAIPGEGEDGPLVQMAVRKLGKGTVVVLSDPFVLTNKGIMELSNLTLAVRLAGLHGDGRVYFDEYHHGFTDPRTIVSYMRERGLHFVLFQVIAVFALFIWRSRSRLGRPRRLEGATERGSAEYVRAFSLIYRRARLHTSVMRSAYELFRERTALWAGLARSSEPKRIYEVLQGKNEKAASRFRTITARLKAAGVGSGDAEVLIFIRLIAGFEKEFLDAGRRTR